MKPEDIQARVLYRDALMLIIDKPAGLPVHAGPGGGDNLERHFDALRFGLPRAPTLAHRLDRDTSGCLILGRHPKALRKLGKLFQEGRVSKTYWAVVAGSPPAEEGHIEASLFKRTNKNGWKMEVVPDGTPDSQASVTDYRVRGRAETPDGPITWVELYPRTGRTHQIRVHMAHVGCPLLGDPAYGGPAGQPLHLHSRGITLPLYPSRDPVGAEAPVPAHLRAALKRCGWTGE
ncbi:RluA family pseudouridine synthase [Nitrospirillum amazonense]|uniref:tRNA pseudouridine32 synthase/23S rRNA pseudouridine746 synthase/23S rRNA pseudouridine1911/1915/1917 synthase n=1 Tax=Nitrospirillum amazonense TaxID=28077 RepID=A0A560JX34_9PROT|nr:RNA pseudouridine synthase [Nitrospirillum amazonense]MDG3440384.1 RNA pseudouridine synthase [Nitrospirillum amazonense]TWB75279.1 tRNA pseudouridine32 synthase/23S rRNA pseudouridine746 synthase/23S rRNA pseudouridine1911/1915/1917 synthase [Nitrospirillum amazonense]